MSSELRQLFDKVLEESRKSLPSPFKIHCIELEDNEPSRYEFQTEDFDNVFLRVQFAKDFNSGNRFDFVFSQQEEHTLVRWFSYFGNKRSEKKSRVLRSCQYYEEAVKFAENWMQACGFEMEAIKVEMSKYSTATSEIKSLPACKGIRIGADDIATFDWWIQKCPEQLEDLQLLNRNEDRETFVLPADFLSQARVMNAKEFYFWTGAAFTDEQFLYLKARNLSFDCLNVTENGINQFLKKWQNGKGVEGFKRALLWTKKGVDQSKLIEGINVRAWDAAFEEEAAGFCGDFERVCGRGTCFQIPSRVDNYVSLTLLISDDCIAIYATGTKMVYNGKTMTSYGVP